MCRPTMKLLLENITRKAKIIDIVGRKRLIDNSNLTHFRRYKLIPVCKYLKTSSKWQVFALKA